MDNALFGAVFHVTLSQACGLLVAVCVAALNGIVLTWSLHAHHASAHARRVKQLYCRVGSQYTQDPPVTTMAL